MKRSKRLLALLMIFCFTFLFTLPAIAEGEFEEPDLAMPVITGQPQESANIRSDMSMNLFVYANIPTDDSLIRYQWFVIENEGANSKKLKGKTDYLLTVPVKDYQNGAKFYCVVYNASDSSPDDGSHRVESSMTTLTIYEAPKIPFWQNFGMNLFFIGFLMTAGILQIVSMPFSFIQWLNRSIAGLLY